MILDKLLEKKDLFIYIDKRIEHLERQRDEKMKTCHIRKRAILRERYRGRILELVLLKQNIIDVKKAAKTYWKESTKYDDDKDLG